MLTAAAKAAVSTSRALECTRCLVISYCDVMGMEYVVHTKIAGEQKTGEQRLDPFFSEHRLLVERRTQDPKDRGSNPVRSTILMCEFSESKMLCPTPLCIRAHKNDHVRTLNIL